MAIKIKKIIDVTDILVFGGTALIATGCWLIYQPAAFLSSGIILLLVGVKGLK